MRLVGWTDEPVKYLYKKYNDSIELDALLCNRRQRRKCVSENKGSCDCLKKCRKVEIIIREVKKKK
jgi:hypothetical protein